MDYEALAKKFGGVQASSDPEGTDYEALAKKFGGAPTPEPTSPPAPVAAAPKPAPEPAAPSFFEQAALNQANAAEIERDNLFIKGGQAGAYGLSGMPSSYVREQYSEALTRQKGLAKAFDLIDKGADPSKLNLEELGVLGKEGPVSSGFMGLEKLFPTLSVASDIPKIAAATKASALLQQYRNNPELRGKLREAATSEITAAQKGIAEAKATQEGISSKISELSEGVPANLTDIRSAGDALKWLAFNSSSGGVQSLPPLITAIVTRNPALAMAASTAMNKPEVLQNRLEFAQEKYKDLPPDQQADAIAKYLTDTGEISTLIAVGMGALDLAGPVGSALRSQVLKVFGKEVANEVGKRTVKEVAKAAVKEVPKEIGEEFLTGGAQQLTQILGQRYLGEQEGDFLSKENLKAIINSAAAEATGAPFGSALNIATQSGAQAYKNYTLRRAEEKLNGVLDSLERLNAGVADALVGELDENPIQAAFDSITSFGIPEDDAIQLVSKRLGTNEKDVRASLGLSSGKEADRGKPVGKQPTEETQGKSPFSEESQDAIAAWRIKNGRDPVTGQLVQEAQDETTTTDTGETGELRTRGRERGVPPVGGENVDAGVTDPATGAAGAGLGVLGESAEQVGSGEAGKPGALSSREQYEKFIRENGPPDSFGLPTEQDLVSNPPQPLTSEDVDPIRGKQPFVVTMKAPDGTIRYGKPGDIHADLYDRMAGEGKIADGWEAGFARGEGQPHLNRVEAAAELNRIKTQPAEQTETAQAESEEIAPYVSEDEQYNTAVNYAREKPSTSYIQRKMSLPYKEASALMGRMEADGIVSAVNSEGNRTFIAEKEAAAETPTTAKTETETAAPAVSVMDIPPRFRPAFQRGMLEGSGGKKPSDQAEIDKQKPEWQAAYEAGFLNAVLINTGSVQQSVKDQRNAETKATAPEITAPTPAAAPVAAPTPAPTAPTPAPAAPSAASKSRSGKGRTYAVTPDPKINNYNKVRALANKARKGKHISQALFEALENRIKEKSVTPQELGGAINALIDASEQNKKRGIRGVTSEAIAAASNPFIRMLSVKSDKMGATGTAKAWIEFAEAKKLIDFGVVKTLSQARAAAEKDYNNVINSVPEFDAKTFLEGVVAVENPHLPQNVRDAVDEYRAGNEGNAVGQLLADVQKTREENVDTWKNYFENVNEEQGADPFWKSYVARGIINSFSLDRPNTGETFNAAALATVYGQFLEGNAPNFSKAYREAKLAASANTVELGDADNGWRKVPQTAASDPDFKDRVAEVQSISSEGWCTKSYNAAPYIQEGDFWVYVANGKPELAIRFIGSDVGEIQGRSNNGTIPAKYAKEVQRLVDSGKIKNLKPHTKKALEKATEESVYLDNLRKETVSTEDIVITTVSPYGSRAATDISIGTAHKTVSGRVVFIVNPDNTEFKYLDPDRIAPTEVGAAVTEYAGDFNSAFGSLFPNLEVIRGSGSVDSTAKLKKLKQVHGEFTVSSGAEVTELEHVYGKLRFNTPVGHLGVEDKIYTINIPKLKSAKELAVPTDVKLQLPSLSQIEDDIFVNGELELTAPATIGGYVYVGSSSRSGGTRKLSTSGDLTVNGALVINEGSEVRGNITVKGYTNLGDGASLLGKVLAEGGVSIEGTANADGLLLVGGTLDITVPSSDAGKTKYSAGAKIDNLVRAKSLRLRGNIKPPSLKKLETVDGAIYFGFVDDVPKNSKEAFVFPNLKQVGRISIPKPNVAYYPQLQIVTDICEVLEGVDAGAHTKLRTVKRLEVAKNAKANTVLVATGTVNLNKNAQANGLLVARNIWADAGAQALSLRATELYSLNREATPNLEFNGDPEAVARITLEALSSPEKYSLGVKDVGMAAADVRAVLSRIALPTPPIVYDTVADARAALNLPLPDNAEAIYYKNNLHLIAENINSELDVEIAVWHEILHKGLDVLYKAGSDAYYVALSDIAAKNANIRNAANKWFSTLGADEIAYAMQLGMGQQQAIRRIEAQAIDEALAQMSSENVEISGLNKFIAVVQNILRKLGLRRLADAMENMTNAEALALINKARGAALAKNAYVVTENVSLTIPSFSRKGAGKTPGANKVAKGAAKAKKASKVVNQKLAEIETSSDPLKVLPAIDENIEARDFNDYEPWFEAQARNLGPTQGASFRRRYLETAPQRVLVENNEEELPPIRRADDLQRAMYAETSKMQAQLGRLVDAVFKFAAVNGQTQLARTMHLARISKLSLQYDTAAEALAKDQELQRINKALADPQTSKAEKGALTRDRNERTERINNFYKEVDALRKQPGGIEIYKRVRDFYRTMYDQYRLLVEKAIEDKLGAGAKSLLKTLQLEEEVGISGDYFPLGRSGNYWLRVNKEHLNLTGTNQPVKREFYQRHSLGEIMDIMRARAAALGLKEGTPEYNKTFSRGDDTKSLGNALRSDSRILQQQSEAINEAVAQFGGKLSDTERDKIADELKDKLYQLYLLRMPENSVRRQFLHAEEVVGYDNNVKRNIAEAAAKYARQIPKLKYAPLIERELQAAKDILDPKSNEERTTEERTRLNAVIDELAVRNETEVLNPTEVPWWSLIPRRLMYFQLLSSVASTVTQLFVMPQRVWVSTATKYGPAKAAKAQARFASVWKTLGIINRDPVFGDTLSLPSYANSKDIRSNPLYSRLYDMGRKLAVFDKTFHTELSNYKDKPENFITNYTKNPLSLAGQILSAPMRAADHLVREHTFMIHASLIYDGLKETDVPYEGVVKEAAIRYENFKKEGFSNEVALEKAAASQAALETERDLGSYLPTELPRKILGVPMTGPVAKLITQFKPFGFNQEVWFINTLYRIYKNQYSAGQRARLSTELTGVLGMQAFVWAGLRGLPLYGAFMGIINLIEWLTDDDEEKEKKLSEDPYYAYNADATFKDKFLPKYFGDIRYTNMSGEQRPLSSIMVNGAMSELTGWDFASRISFDHMIFREGRYDPSKVNYAVNFLTANLGPSVTQGVSFIDALRDLEKGDTERGLGSVAPKGVGAPAKSVKYASEGVVTRTGKVIVGKEELSIPDLVGTGLGYTPIKVKEAYEAMARVNDTQKYIESEASKIRKAYNNEVTRPEGYRLEEIKKIEQQRNTFTKRFPTFADKVDDAALDRSLESFINEREQSIGGIRITDQNAPYVIPMLQRRGVKLPGGTTSSEPEPEE